MATTTSRRRPVRTLVVLTLAVVVLFGGLLAGTRWGGATLAPKLALDLEGGTQIILTPVSETDEAVTEDAINQAIEIIRQRVDASGVAEAEITSQGAGNIVVALPGRPSEETLDLVRESARMLFRPVIYVANPGPVEQPTDAGTEAPADGATDAPADGSLDAPADGAEPPADGADEPADDGASEDDAAGLPGLDEVDTAGVELASATVAATGGDEAAGSTDGATAEPTSDATTEPTAEPTTEPTAPAEPAEPTSASDFSWVTDEVMQEFNERDCTAEENLRGGGALEGDPEAAVVACDATGAAKYVLGPVELYGDRIASASSGFRVTSTGAVTNERVVNIDFDNQGTAEFREVTTRLIGLEPPRNQFAMVLDGLVIMAPSVNNVINDGNAEISGNFTQAEAETLARQLNFGSLPLTFEVQSEQQISATLGSEQLQRGVLAGLIGLGLVGLYSLLQYRALGLVTIVSLAAAAVLAYVSIAYLSWIQGYRLSLAGVAGLIVAIGITADSFIVYFERIRDELRDGRALVAAVDEGWRRARRTIIVSDAVSFLAAVVLYLVSVGGVRGFAFTLGLTTLIDLAVVAWFTHPVMQVLARTRFFGEGHRLSGVDPSLLAGSRARYAGRGRVVTPTAPAAGARGTDASAEPVPAGTRLTIAERRALAEREAGGSSTTTDERKDG